MTTSLYRTLPEMITSLYRTLPEMITSLYRTLPEMITSLYRTLHQVSKVPTIEGFLSTYIIAAGLLYR